MLQTVNTSLWQGPPEAFMLEGAPSDVRELVSAVARHAMRAALDADADPEVGAVALRVMPESARLSC